MENALVLLVLLVTILVVAEVVTRRVITDRLTGRLSEVAGYPIVVALSPRPIVLQYFGMVPHVRASGFGAGGEWTDVRADRLTLGNRTTIGELRGIIEVDGIVVTGTADDLTYDKSRLTHVRGIDASAQISFERLMALAAGSAGTGTVTSISGDIARSTLRVKVSAQVMIVPVPVAITLKPRVDHGRIRFTVLRAEVFGAYVLADFVQMFVNRLTLNLDALTEAVTVVGVEVSDAGIAAAFTANDVVVGGGASGWRMVRSPGWADSDTADGSDPEDRAEPMAG